MTILPYPKPINSVSTKKMRSNRRTDTKPEIALRSALHRSGLRFRKDYPIRLPDGRTVHPDIAFTKKKIAIFVDGCFWHSCPEHGSTPKSNQDYWIPKLSENVERDKCTDTGLRANGWQVVRVWEHSGPEEAVEIILCNAGSKISVESDS